MSEKFECGWMEFLNDKDPYDMSMQELKELLVDKFPAVWLGPDGGDNGMVGCLGDDEVTLMLEPHEELGYYLCYIMTDKSGDETFWVSMYDETKLANYVESLATVEASEGLYLPPKLAWEAIKTFIETGKMSDKIKWVRSEDLPDEATY